MIRIAWIGKSLEDKRIRLSYGVFLFYVMNLPLLILAHELGAGLPDMCWSSSRCAAFFFQRAA